MPGPDKSNDTRKFSNVLTRADITEKTCSTYGTVTFDQQVPFLDLGQVDVGLERFKEDAATLAADATGSVSGPGARGKVSRALTDLFRGNPSSTGQYRKAGGNDASADSAQGQGGAPTYGGFGN